ncbi:MAG: hypothetical protein AB1640_19380 [bacterium]
MRFYPILDFQYWVFAFLVGVVTVILVYMAWGSYSHRREQEVHLSPEQVHELEEHDLPRNPIAPFIFVAWGITIAWAIGYCILVGVFGDAI